jgi:hypothetical protein
MKLLATILILSSIVLGRENPFEPTQTFLDQKQQLLIKQQSFEYQSTIKEIQQEDDTVEYQSEPVEAVSVQNAPETLNEEASQFTLKEGCKESYSFRLTDFINIEVKTDRLLIQVDPRHPLVNQDIHKDIQKFVFDFHGKKSFYTKRENICSNYFENISVGSHEKKGFFRIVLKTTLHIDNYIESIDTANNIIDVRIINTNK